MEWFSPQLTIHFHAVKETKRQISHVQTRVAKGQREPSYQRKAAAFLEFIDARWLQMETTVGIIIIPVHSCRI
jgi:hypothetical protein